MCALIDLLAQDVERESPALAEELGVGKDETSPELGRDRLRQLVGVQDPRNLVLGDTKPTKLRTFVSILCVWVKSSRPKATPHQASNWGDIASTRFLIFGQNYAHLFPSCVWVISSRPRATPHQALNWGDIASTRYLIWGDIKPTRKRKRVSILCVGDIKPTTGDLAPSLELG